MMQCDKIKHIMITGITALIPSIVPLLVLMPSDGPHRYSITYYCILFSNDLVSQILFFQVDWQVLEGKDHVL